MNTKNMLFICANYPEPGGVETVTGLLADFFLGQDWKVNILILRDIHSTATDNHRHAGLLVEMPGPLNSPSNLSFIDAFIRANKIVCVFNQGVFSQIYLNASKHPHTKFVNTLHSRPFWEVYEFMHRGWEVKAGTRKDLLGQAKIQIRHLLGLIHPDWSHPNIKRFYRLQIESVHAYVVLDEAFKKELEVKLYQGVPQPKIQVIPNPLQSGARRQVPKKREVLYIGRLKGEPKRVDRLLRIWSDIEEQVPEWSLIIVGDGEDRTHLEQMARTLQLKHCHFKGFQEPTPYYQTASILCLTSTYEGSPMVITEAQSYGAVPLVFGSVESMYSLIDDGMNGIIVPPFDEKAFADDLYRLIRDEKRLAYLSENALNKVKDLDLDTIGQKWMRLLKE